MAALLAAPQVHAAFDAPAAALVAEARTYELGLGVTKDPVRAARLYCKAARFGDVEAQYSLGLIYADGRGVARDDPVSALFFMLPNFSPAGSLGKSSIPS